MSEEDSPKTEKAQPILGGYRMVQPLGSGGMSSVFRAVHVESGNEVAVKVLPRAMAKNPTMLQRFLREAKSAESLQHPGIVSIYDRGVDQGRHYLVLELVAGGDLYDRVKAQGPMGLPDSVAVIRGVAEALKYAASKGLIHRDIKPANILMSPSGQVKLIDLGLALQASDEDERVTRDGTTVGTVDFMAPEQARDSRATSIQSDMYSLGCTLYYLLTGQAPFPGGDIVDKLKRHFTQAPPDPKLVRPEVPAPLSILVRRLMAKRPEKRFSDYDELISELDAVPTSPEFRDEQPLDVLIDEDDDQPLDALIDDDDPPLEAIIVDDDDDEEDESPRSAEISLTALIDEDKDADGAGDDVDLLRLPDESPSRRDPASAPEADPLRAEISMAELAALDDSSRPSLPTRPKPPARPPSKPAIELVPDEEPADLDPDSGSFRDDVVSSGMPGQVASLGGRMSDEATRKWIIRCAGAGLAIVALIIGIHQLYKVSVGPTIPTEEVAEAPSEPESAPEPEPVVLATPAPAPLPKPAPKPTPKPAPEPPSPSPTPKPPEPPPVTAWVEPGDPVVAIVAEPRYGPEVESRFVPDWARSEIPSTMFGPLVRVRRVVDPRDPAQKPTLRLAFDVIGGTVEVEDRGPFFEDDPRIFGESRLIRASKGSRSIIYVEAPQLDVLKRQPALFVLEGKNVILEGLDLVVNVKDLLRDQSAMFLCRGASLTLRNCSITVVNPGSEPFAVFRTAGSKPSRIRLEETFVRGPALSGFDIGGPSDIVLSRSVLVGGRGPLVAAPATGQGGERRVNIVRSLLACPGPIFDLGSGGAHANPLVVSALGSTFARIAASGSASLIASRDDAGGPGDLVRWSGEYNQFRGWGDWLSAGNGHKIKLASLAAARSTWPTTDVQSLEQGTAWPVLGDFDRLAPGSLVRYAPESHPTLTRVADPSPFLLEKTVDSFEPAAIPKLATVVMPSIARTPPPSLAPAPNPSASKSWSGTTTPPPAPMIRDLFLDTAASPWKGDLGAYFRDQVRDGDSRVRIWVRGGGAFPCSPIRPAEGVSLEVRAEPTSPAAANPPVWSPVASGPSEALIDIHGGDLVLSGVEFRAGRKESIKHLVRVEDGHLVLDRCRLSAPGVEEPGKGALVAFRATSTRPFARGLGPFVAAPDLPVCLVRDSVLITGGDALSAEIGRGVVSLSQSLVSAGGRAFVLQPANVSRSRFEAAFALDRCTVAAEKTFAFLGRWPGKAPGPDRPWLVTTSHCAFVAGFDRGALDCVLLRVEPDAMAQGVLGWEAHNDAFEVVQFTARSDRPPPPVRGPDLRHHWVELWGESHMRGVIGPSRTGGQPSVRFRERLHAGGDIQPGDLALDLESRLGRPDLDLGADLDRLQIKPTHPLRRRKE